MFLRETLEQHFARSSHFGGGPLLNTGRRSIARQLLAAFIAASVLVLGLSATAENADLTDSQELELQPQKVTPEPDKSIGSHFSQAKTTLQNNKPEHNALLGATLGGLLTGNPAGIFIGGAVAGAITRKPEANDTHTNKTTTKIAETQSTAAMEANRNTTGIYDDISPQALVMPIDHVTPSAGSTTPKTTSSHEQPSEKKAPLQSQLATSALNMTYMSPTNERPTFDHLSAKHQSSPQNKDMASASYAQVTTTNNPNSITTAKNKSAAVSPTTKMSTQPKMAKAMEKPRTAKEQLPAEANTSPKPKQKIATAMPPAKPVLPSSCFDTSDNQKRQRPRHCFYMLY